MSGSQTFQDMFFESSGQPVFYKDKWIHLNDRFYLGPSNAVIITFEETNSEWRQGVRLDINGHFWVANQRIEHAMVLWADTAPRQTKVIAETPGNFIEVRNVWDVGDGVTHSWHAGAAMIIEILDNGKRYFCNDGHLDDDFTDLIFRVERVSEPAIKENV